MIRSDGSRTVMIRVVEIIMAERWLVAEANENRKQAAHKIELQELDLSKEFETKFCRILCIAMEVDKNVDKKKYDYLVS